MLSQDFNGDGHLDILLIGNDYGTELFTGRYGAITGLYLIGDGKGGFQTTHMQHSGFFAMGDAKGLAKLYDAQGQELILVSQNQDSLHVFTKREETPNSGEIVSFKPMDAWTELHLDNGKARKEEFYYGSTYLSQSSRQLKIGPEVTAVTIYDFAGHSRKVNLKSDELVAKLGMLHFFILYYTLCCKAYSIYLLQVKGLLDNMFIIIFWI